MTRFWPLFQCTSLLYNCCMQTGGLFCSVYNLNLTYRPFLYLQLYRYNTIHKWYRIFWKVCCNEPFGHLEQSCKSLAERKRIKRHALEEMDSCFWRWAIRNWLFTASDSQGWGKQQTDGLQSQAYICFLSERRQSRHHTTRRKFEIHTCK